MKQVIFWGTRGSLPVALTSEEVKQKLISTLKIANGRSFSDRQEIVQFVDSLPFSTGRTFGGNSSCVEIVTDSAEHIICDMGSGARVLGLDKIARYGKPKPQCYHTFISHLHWDHLMGFPFFEPMYIAGNHIVIHGCHDRLEEAVRLQMRAPCFPVDYSELGVTIEFDYLKPGQASRIAGLDVTPMQQLHTGDSYAYRFEQAGKSVVYATDAEYPPDEAMQYQNTVDFFKDANLVIFDAMYSLAEISSVRSNWGHSCNIVGAEICLEANVKTLALFHHDPGHDDIQLEHLLEETRRFVTLADSSKEKARTDSLNVISAYDGLVYNL